MNKDDKLSILRHSAAHLVAHAVTRLFPNTKLTIGPATKSGFFYDMLPEVNLKEEDLPVIEAEMHKIVQENYPIEHKQISKKEAREIYKENPFKLELIDQIPDETVGIAKQGDFFDLCRGGHVSSTGEIKHFKLLGISGAYWRADINNAALQRISGTALFTAKELRLFEKHQEEVKKYDHRKVGKELNLFSFHQEGVGFPFFHPKGQKIINIMCDYLRKELDDANYDEISTPTMLSDNLWRQSGHYQHYKDNMYFCNVDEKHYAIKPMNCPGAILVYSQKPHSYRELPLRLAEFGKVHRHELSGVLHGLLRVRAFTQDDGHIFCTDEQIEQEVITTIQMTIKILKKFGFENVTIGLSTKPKKAMGTDAMWDHAIESLKNALEKSKQSYEIYEGEGAFYGPKIEFGIEDSMGRSWQCSTIQLDFFLPENFNLTYVCSEGTKKQPVMIHRAIYGSLERFFAIVLEHHKGRLPLWLSPIQARVLTITDTHNEYAQQIVDQLKQHGLRIERDTSSDPISGKIKSAQLARIPWMIIIGDKEVANNTVTLRFLNGKQEFGLNVEQLIERIEK